MAGKVGGYYVEIASFPHFGEHAVYTGKKRLNADGEMEIKFIMLDCCHGNHEVWLTREDLPHKETLPF